MEISAYISINTLIINGLNDPTKRYRLADWIQTKIHMYAVYKRSISDQGTHTDCGDVQRYFHGNQKKDLVEIQDKTYLKLITNTRDKEGLYIIIKESIEEDIKIINIYAPNTGTAQCIRKMLRAIKREIDSNIIIVGDFNNSLSSMDVSSRQNINRKTQALDDTFDHMVLIDIYGAF